MSNNLYNENRKIKNWTALRAVKIVSFILIIAMAFVTLNRFVAIDNRVSDTRLGVDIIWRNVSHEQHFFNRHMHNALASATRALRFESEESIRAGNHLIWVRQPVEWHNDVHNEASDIPHEDANFFQGFIFPTFSEETILDEDGNVIQTNTYDEQGRLIAELIYDEENNRVRVRVFNDHGLVVEDSWQDLDSPIIWERSFDSPARTHVTRWSNELMTPDGSRFYAHIVGDDSPHNRSVAERNAINDQLEEFRWAMEYLEETAGLKYHISDTRGNVIANVAADFDWFRSQPLYLIVDGDSFVSGSHLSTHGYEDTVFEGTWVSRVLNPDEILVDTGLAIPQFTIEQGQYWRNLLNWSSEIAAERNAATIHLAFTNEAFGAERALFAHTREAFMWDFANIATAIVLALALFTVLMVGAGRKFAVSKAEGVHFSGIDKPFLDISLAFVLFWCFIWLFVSVSFVNQFLWSPIVINTFIAVLSVAVIAPILIWFMSFAKRVKAGKFWKHTLIYRAPRKLIMLLKPIWHGFKVMPKVAVISAAAFFALLFIGIVGDVTISRNNGLVFVFALIFTAVIAFLLTRYALRLYALEQAARKTGEGEYDETIDVGGGELGSIANSINNISAGINVAVEQRMKSERLKTELITNVSHDIRTPLTSIITYTDLLQKEGLKSKKAPEYLDILIQKSQRLKTLTDELFEAAKASTGNIDVNITELDLVSLVNQVLGELDSSIKSSGLDLRVNMPESMHVKADGRLMWRVLENLLSNVFKYSLPNSRVYIDVFEESMLVRLDMKNISSDELNIDPAELMDRFKRGDDSRADGGNGLGLSIVQSFVAAQGGTFEIAIDGDLFKASVFLPAGE